jgi:hypothetical protein
VLVDGERVAKAAGVHKLWGKRKMGWRSGLGIENGVLYTGVMIDEDELRRSKDGSRSWLDRLGWIWAAYCYTGITTTEMEFSGWVYRMNITTPWPYITLGTRCVLQGFRYFVAYGQRICSSRVVLMARFPPAS